MMKRLLSATLAAGLLFTPVLAEAASDPVHTSWRNNIAAGGMDVVTFFSDLFLANPEQFAPQYGGYCAWAVAQGKLAAGNPKYWAVEDGRLYFNYNSRIQKRWDKTRAEFIVSGDQNWPGLIAD